MRFLRSKRGLAVAGVLLLFALFLIRPGGEWLRTRIVSSISVALGRPVDVGSVHLRLFPQPGFDLEQFVVHDDPGFSAEPMLRAQEVTAALRVRSLLHGRLEIARLNLTEPSLNLVRTHEGHWNLEDLLERAAKTPVAPTSKATTESRPGFPYIQADSGRINFKFGQEKKPYALTDADFAVWQDSENAWGMRLKAQPLRTDLNLTDTGTISISGSWQRAATLHETPLQLSMQWVGAQLGQVSKLASGNDKGWRGTIKVSASLTGRPADLMVQTQASIQDFRRYDILGGGALQLTAQCSGHYNSADQSVSNLACQAPVADGSVTVDGEITGPAGSRAYNLALIAHDVPLQSLAAFARHAKKDIPDDLLAGGKLNANVKVKRDGDTGAEVVWQGGGETAGFHLTSKLTKTELVLDRIAFTVAPGAETSLETRVEVAPFNLALGRPTPAVARGWISQSGYGLIIHGDAQLQKLLQAARTVGLPASQPAADGIVSVDLQIAGDWPGFIAPRAVGKAQLRSVRAEVRGLNAPLEISTANLALTQDEVQVQNLSASLAGSAWHGSLALPRRCAGPVPCPVSFDLHADQIATDELSQLLNPHPRQQPWYRFLSSPAQPGISYLSTLRAGGKLTANRMAIHTLAGTHVSADVELENGKLRLSNVRGEVLGGKHVGEWQADFTSKPPQYSGHGTLERVALGQLADAMRDNWITGTATGTYRATASGLTAADLLSSADATVQVEARDGLLPHIVLGSGTGALQMRHLEGRFLLQNGKFAIEQGKLETPAGIYQVSGTASLGRTLDLKLIREGGHGFNITGTLTAPHVATATTPETQAALKP